METNQTLFQSFLEQIGLSEKEALVYELLLTKGEQTVGALSAYTAYKKGDLYNILYSLRDRSLIEQQERSGVAHFVPRDPHLLTHQIDIQKAKVDEAAAAANLLIPQMSSLYNLAVNQPAVQHYEGIPGMEKVYAELLSSKTKELLLFRSVFDKLDPATLAVIEKAVKKETELGMRLKVITPREERTKRHYLTTDKDQQIERHIVEPDYLHSPAQIMIWNDTVAIVTFRQNIISTLIQHPDIAETFRNIFWYMWKKSEPFHEQTVKEWRKN